MDVRYFVSTPTEQMKAGLIAREPRSCASSVGLGTLALLSQVFERLGGRLSPLSAAGPLATSEAARAPSLVLPARAPSPMDVDEQVVPPRSNASARPKSCKCLCARSHCCGLCSPDAGSGYSRDGSQCGCQHAAGQPCSLHAYLWRQRFAPRSAKAGKHAAHSGAAALAAVPPGSSTASGRETEMSGRAAPAGASASRGLALSAELRARGRGPGSLGGL